MRRRGVYPTDVARTRIDLTSLWSNTSLSQSHQRCSPALNCAKTTQVLRFQSRSGRNFDGSPAIRPCNTNGFLTEIAADHEVQVACTSEATSRPPCWQAVGPALAILRVITEIHLGHCFSALARSNRFSPEGSWHRILKDLIEPWQCSILRSIRSPCGNIAPDGPI
jgi:hypothetical protein